MRRFVLFSLLLLLTSSPGFAQAPQTSASRPALVLTIVVDQMRYDYLPRYGAEFTGGLKRLLNEGAVFTNANYEAVPSVTAIGHSTILSDATPSASGIAANTWYERSEGKNVQSITDEDVTPLGGTAGASPKRLAVSTVGDELKVSGKGGKVYGVSLKDRGAILPAGRMADGAFWFDGSNGMFVSSTGTSRHCPHGPLLSIAPNPPTTLPVCSGWVHSWQRKLARICTANLMKHRLQINWCWILH